MPERLPRPSAGGSRRRRRKSTQAPRSETGPGCRPRTRDRRGPGRVPRSPGDGSASGCIAAGCSGGCARDPGRASDRPGHCAPWRSHSREGRQSARSRDRPEFDAFSPAGAAGSRSRGPPLRRENAARFLSAVSTRPTRGAMCRSKSVWIPRSRASASFRGSEQSGDQGILLLWRSDRLTTSPVSSDRSGGLPKRIY